MEKDVDVIKPRDFLFIPSHSNYKISKQLVVEPIEGDPMKILLIEIYFKILFMDFLKLLVLLVM